MLITSQSFFDPVDGIDLMAPCHGRSSGAASNQSVQVGKCNERNGT